MRIPSWLQVSNKEHELSIIEERENARAKIKVEAAKARKETGEPFAEICVFTRWSGVEVEALPKFFKPWIVVEMEGKTFLCGTSYARPVKSGVEFLDEPDPTKPFVAVGFFDHTGADVQVNGNHMMAVLEGLPDIAMLEIGHPSVDTPGKRIAWHLVQTVFLDEILPSIQSAD